MITYIHKNSRSQITVEKNEATITDLHTGRSRKQFVKVDGQNFEYVTRFGKKILLDNLPIVKNNRFTIVDVSGTMYYDTYDFRFYPVDWNKTYDSKEYLQSLIENNPDEFEGCSIEEEIVF